MQKNKIFIIATVLVLTVVFFAAKRFAANTKEEDSTAPSPWVFEALERPDSFSVGDSQAPVTVVEFFDPECEACAAFHPSVEKLKSEYPTQVRWIYRYMPFHPNSMYAAAVLEEARAHGKFLEALTALFEAQPQWASHENPKPQLIAPIVSAIGVPAELLKKEEVIAKHQTLILRDQSDGQRVMVSATPAFYINGRPLFSLGYDSLKAAIERAISEKRAN